MSSMSAWPSPGNLPAVTTLPVEAAKALWMGRPNQNAKMVRFHGEVNLEDSSNMHENHLLATLLVHRIAANAAEDDFLSGGDKV